MFDPIAFIAEWMRGLMAGWGWSDAVIISVNTFVGAFVVAGLIMVIFILLTWMERKIAARFQDRIGPNRVGPFGLFQPIADAVKMVTKEDTTPDSADKFSYNFAPILGVASVLMMWAVIPFAAQEGWVGTSLNVGVLYMAAVGSFGVISILMAGWSSNNKYALLGAFRGVAQLISYEVPLFLSLLVPVFLARSMDVNEIIAAQVSEGSVWFIFTAPLAFVIFFISSLAEIGRSPFDLLEAESEIVAGYHVEYSGMKFGLFQAMEFIHSLTVGAMVAILFLGGWSGPGAENSIWLGVLYLSMKMFFFYGVIVWSRSTLPRLRIDQMMDFNWKFMVPVSLVYLMTLPLVDYFTKGLAYRSWIFLGLSVLIGSVAISMAAQNAKRNELVRERFPERAVAVPPKEEAA